MLCQRKRRKLDTDILDDTSGTNMQPLNALDVQNLKICSELGCGWSGILIII